MKMYHAISRFMILLALTLGLLIYATAQTTKPTPVEPDDLVHFGDLIDVDVVGGFEFDWRGRLSPDGNLEGFDSYGDPIAGLCRSESQIASDIAKALSKILREPKIVVRIVDRSDRAVTLLDGAVRTPTRFRLRRPVRLLELIVMAGGLTDNSNGEISILRPGRLSCSQNMPDNKTEVSIIKISDLLAGRETGNPRVLTGDVISATAADPIYVIGAVGNPRPISSREQLTVSRAIAMAGGLVKNADAGKISVFRRQGGETRIIDIDLAKIKSGEMIDEVLRPFDILDVAAKGGEKRKFPPLSVRDDGRVKNTGELPLKIVE